VDVRVLTLEDAREIESRIRNLQPVVPGVSLEIEGHVRRPPLEPTPRNQALWRAALQAGQELGLELESATAGGGSDGNLTSQFVATLDGLGAVGDGAHARHEFVVLDRLAERTALLARLLSLPAEVPAV
jgi:glutamate carboxypeptidase